MKRISQAVAWFLLFFSVPALAAAPVSVQISYDVYKGSLKVAQIDETFTRDQDRYTLSSVSKPSGLLALFKKETITVTSSGVIGKHGLQPQQYSYRRAQETGRNVSAELDWNTRKLTLIHDGQRNVVDLPQRTQDRLSAMYQFMFLNLQNTATLDFPMTNGNKLDQYHYAIAPSEKLSTPAGQFSTLYLDSQAKPGETRSEIWLATDRHNLPCQMTITDSHGGQLTQVVTRLQVR